MPQPRRKYTPIATLPVNLFAHGNLSIDCGGKELFDQGTTAPMRDPRAQHSVDTLAEKRLSEIRNHNADDDDEPFRSDLIDNNRLAH